MKIWVSVTVELDDEQVKTLKRMAKASGHGFDGTTDTRRLIRRLLESKVRDTVSYCHEQIDKE